MINFRLTSISWSADKVGWKIYSSSFWKKYTNPSDVKDLTIDQSFNSKLNKLKKGNPEAFFYWYQIFLMEKGDLP